MQAEGIFSGLKVVDLASFIAGPSAERFLCNSNSAPRPEKFSPRLTTINHDYSGAHLCFGPGARLWR